MNLYFSLLVNFIIIIDHAFKYEIFKLLFEAYLIIMSLVLSKYTYLPYLQYQYCIQRNLIHNGLPE